MFVRPEVVVPTIVFEAESKRIASASVRLVEEVQRYVLPASAKRTDQTINQALGVHRRPTDWQTPKQRRWWYAIGITRWRGRRPKQDWKIVAVLRASSGEIGAQNAMPGAKYVFKPPFQQRMHMGVWMTTDTYATIERRALALDIGAAWARVTTGTGRP